jgi:hypothetical protein
MPQYFLLRPDNTFSDLGQYTEKPLDRNDGVWIEGSPNVPAYQITTPLEQITTSVKQLPIEKRTNPEFGTFLSQCLLAIQNNDNQALGYLIGNFNTQDPDYIALLASAKTLFGIS